MIADFHILSDNPKGFEVLIEFGVEETGVHTPQQEWKERVTAHKPTHQMFLATSFINSIFLSNVGNIRKLQKLLTEKGANDDEYTAIPEEDLIRMEDANQSLQAIQSFYYLNVSRGFPERCSEVSQFPVDVELLEMLVEFIVLELVIS